MTLADQVTTLINAAAIAENWPLQFRAERLTFPLRSIESLDLVAVSVFDGPRASLLFTRGEWNHTKTIYVVVQRKLAAESAEQTIPVDELVDLLERIETLFETIVEDTFADWRFESFDESTDRLPFSPALLRDESTFAAVVGLDFVD